VSRDLSAYVDAPRVRDRPCLFVDGSNLLMRLVFSPGGDRPYAAAGMFLARVFEVARPEADAETVVAFDTGRTSAWRRELWPGYKAARRERRDEPAARDAWARYEACRVVLESALPALGADLLAADGVEADDLAHHHLRVEPGRTGAWVLSGDRDLVQLLVPGNSGERGALYWIDPNGPTFWTAETWGVQKGVMPCRWPEYRALTGDDSDGIPGLRGIGDVRARRLLATYPSLSAALADAARVPPGMALSSGVWDGLRVPEAPAALARNLMLMDLSLAPRVVNARYRRGRPDAAAYEAAVAPHRELIGGPVHRRFLGTEEAAC
jgi:DNA polymerase-1